VLVGTETKVLDGFPSVLGTTEEESVCSSWRPQSQLIQSQSLTSSLLDASSGSGGESKSGHGKLGDSQKTVVIGNGADHDDGFALVRLGHIRDEAGDRDGGAVDTGHEQTAEHNLVEVGFRAA
jgi:hypothetical protein